MKKIAILLIVLNSILAAQANNVKSFELLKSDLRSMESNFNEKDFKNYLNPNTSPQKKKTGLAILYSFLLPGMGELYAENYNSGKYFTIADGVLWGLFIGFNVHANNQEDNYKAHAKAFASINPDGKTELYFANVGNYMNIDDYNNEMLLNRDFDAVYNVETHYWRWETKEQRREYRNTWSSSENSYNNIKFVVWGLLLNRVVSAINAVRLVAAYNNKLETSEVGWNLSLDLEKYHITMPTQMTVNFQTSL